MPGSSGATIWPVGRIRSEIERLLADLELWRPYPHAEVADGLRVRANRLLLHLRSQPGAQDRNFPADYEFGQYDVLPGSTVLSRSAAGQLEEFLRSLPSLLPGGGTGPRTALGLDGLHPRVHAVAAEAWQAGDFAGAVAAAETAVEERLRALSGLTSSGEELVDAAVGEIAPRIHVADPATPEGAQAQSGCRHLATGLHATAAIVRGAPGELTDQRAHELLGVASLVLHALEFAKPAPR
jgi:hypothetical protein